MLTVKCRTYTNEELDTLYDVLEWSVELIQSISCKRDCQNCDYKHLCIDLQSALLYTGDVIKSRE